MTAYTEVSSNQFKTWVIMLGFAFFITFVIFIFGSAYGLDVPSALSFSGIALILAGIMNFFAYYNSDKLVMKIAGAKQIQKRDNPVLFRTVENLTIASGLPMPRIYIIDDAAPNAFATGRDPKHASIAFTTGILQKLNKLELEGVTAHELSHVGNYDTRVMTIVSILVGTVALAADFFLRMAFFSRGNRRNSNALFMIIGLVMAILAPIVAMIIQLAISRKREYLADASGALLTRHPEGLASALLKISSDHTPLKSANKATAHLYIENPFKDKHKGTSMFAKLFNTHPPVAERVKKLRSMQ